MSRRRRRSATALVLLSVLVLTSCAGGAGSSTSPAGSQSATSPSEVASSEPSIDAGGLTGRIAFMRGDPSKGVAEAGVTYTVNPDGSDSNSWSRKELGVPDLVAGRDRDTCLLLRRRHGRALRRPCHRRYSAQPRATRSRRGDLLRRFLVARRTSLSCEGFGVEDSSLNGAYTIHASDGGGLQRITSNPDGFDAPGDFSPDGERLVFTRFVDEEPVGVCVTNLDGSGLAQSRLRTSPLTTRASRGAGRRTGVRSCS